jgi:hypothetical protein
MGNSITHTVKHESSADRSLRIEMLILANVIKKNYKCGCIPELTFVEGHKSIHIALIHACKL